LASLCGNAAGDAVVVMYAKTRLLCLLLGQRQQGALRSVSMPLCPYKKQAARLGGT